MAARNPLPPARWIVSGFRCEAHPMATHEMEAVAEYTFANRPPLTTSGIGRNTQEAVDCAMRQAAEEGVE